MPAIALLCAVLIYSLPALAEPRNLVLCAMVVLAGWAIRWRAHRGSLLLWAGAVALLCTLPLLDN